MAKRESSGNASTLVSPEVKELKQSVERLQALMEEIPTGILSVDIKGKITYVNKAILQGTGYSRQELVGKSAFRLGLIPPETLKLLKRRMAEKLVGKPPRPLEMQFKRKDGTWMWLQIRGRTLWEHGVLVGVQVVGEDVTERKQAEEALRQSEEKYRRLFELSPIGITTVDMKGVITECNPAVYKEGGYSEDELVGKHFSKIAPVRVRDIPKQMRVFSSIIRGKVPKPFEVAYNRKDGTIGWTEVHIALLEADGKKLGVQVLQRDITERKQAEEALRESQEALRKMFESVTDGIAVIDLNGVITEVNQGAVEMHGFDSKDELLGKSAFELVAPSDHERIATNMRKALKQGSIKGVEYTLLKADGSEFLGELSTSVLTDASDNPVGHITIVRDITERKQAEAALRLQRAYFQQLFDNSPDAIALLDTDDRVVQANKGFEKLFGYRAEEVKGRFINDIVVPEDRIEEASALSRATLNNQVRRRETVRKRKNGSLVDVSIVGYPIRFGDKTVGVYAIYSDITERKRMEQEIRDKNAQLEAQNQELQAANEELREAQERLIRSEKLAAVGQLASGVGHELRNPLGAIKNAAFYVRRRIAKSDLPASEPKVLEFLDIIDGEVSGANKVITDLLGFSRVAKPTVSPVKIGGIIEDALGYVPMPEKVELTRGIDENLPMVMVDGDQIRQVFINIIHNAVQAMPEGGRLEIRAKSKDEFVEVEFTDTGCGIPQSAIDNIFDPLFTTKAKGIGLGLSVCQSVLERHGGDIGVESREGEGTTFTVSLPTQTV